MDYDLRHPPWTDRGLIPEEEFLAAVEQALGSAGRWETYAENRMGGGPRVRVTVEQSGDRTVYRAEGFMGSVVMSATYETLDQALTAMPVFGRAVWGVVEERVWQGTVEPPPD
jgi:hypothetical protein